MAQVSTTRTVEMSASSRAPGGKGTGPVRPRVSHTRKSWADPQVGLIVSTSQVWRIAGKQFHDPENETVQDTALLHRGGKDARWKPPVGKRSSSIVGGDWMLGTDGSLGKMR